MKYLIPFLALFIVGCATTTPKKYRRLTPQKRLTAEERRKQAVLNYYKKLRADAMKRGQYINKSKKHYSYIPKRKLQKRPSRPAIQFVDKKSQKVEIEQNMIFFCMEKRKSNRFDQNNSCESYAKNIFDDCSIRYADGDPRLTRCVKSGLR